MQSINKIVNIFASESVYQIEYNIKKLIQNDNDCSTHFEYSKAQFGGQSVTKLTLITYNPSHKKHFLLHSLEAQTRLMAVKAMYRHIFTLKTKSQDNYSTVKFPTPCIHSPTSSTKKGKSMHMQCKLLFLSLNVPFVTHST